MPSYIMPKHMPNQNVQKVALSSLFTADEILVGQTSFSLKKAVQIHSVLDLVVSRLFPFYIVSKANVMGYVQYEKIYMKTLKKYMGCL